MRMRLRTRTRTRTRVPGRRLATCACGGALLVLGLIGPSGCMPAPTPPLPHDDADAATAVPEPVAFADAEALAAHLTESGLELSPLGDLRFDWFEVPSLTFEMGDDALFIHDFGTVEAVQEAAGRVAPNGSRVTLPDGRDMLVQWLGVPHLYLRDTLLVVYVGESTRVMDLLTAALGPQFAGAAVPGEGGS